MKISKIIEISIGIIIIISGVVAVSFYADPEEGMGALGIFLIGLPIIITGAMICVNRFTGILATIGLLLIFLTFVIDQFIFYIIGVLIILISMVYAFFKKEY